MLILISISELWLTMRMLLSSSTQRECDSSQSQPLTFVMASLFVRTRKTASGGLDSSSNSTWVEFWLMTWDWERQSKFWPIWLR
ncbi:hypothetical protein ECANGB1_2664 [Enterospora canceri]|uniref:Secreted protein n=1 Tax=Enterospora canceri TaxID=1081671 RepID=A0A1Y1S6A8_9MICR|nr:hypothetical protein ECANGB1_2664 [Enterospora canceri]